MANDVKKELDLREFNNRDVFLIENEMRQIRLQEYNEMKEIPINNTLYHALLKCRNQM